MSIKTLLDKFTKWQWLAKRKSLMNAVWFYGVDISGKVGEGFRVKERFAGRVQSILERNGYRVSKMKNGMAKYEPKSMVI